MSQRATVDQDARSSRPPCMLTSITVSRPKPRVSVLGWFTVLGDFGSSPLEVFDGVEPNQIICDPGTLGHPEFSKVNLLGPQLSPECDLPADTLADLSALLPARVLAFDKSSNRMESHIGYFAVAESLNSSERLWIFYSFFEVSPGRYHGYLHALIRQNFNRNA